MPTCVAARRRTGSSAASEAGAVGRFLADQGVPGNRMQLGSWGEDQPKVDARTAEANAENRRVDVVVLN